MCSQLRCLILRRSIPHIASHLDFAVNFLFHRMPLNDYHPAYSDANARWWISLTCPVTSQTAAAAVLAAFASAVGKIQGLVTHTQHGGDMHVFERQRGHARICLYLPVTCIETTRVPCITYACFENETALVPVIKRWHDDITAMPKKLVVTAPPTLPYTLHSCLRHQPHTKKRDASRSPSPPTEATNDSTEEPSWT